MKKKNTVYFDVTGINTLDEYYTKQSITKAIAGIPQTREDINMFIEGITTSVIEELFRDGTIAIYKNGNVLVRIPKQALVSIPDNATKPEPKKKEGFFKRAWKKLTGRK